jgi:hypothetical protein
MHSVETDTGLLLPNGQIAGHRSLLHIWRQEIVDTRVSDAVLINRMVMSRSSGGGLMQWKKKEVEWQIVWQKKRDLIRCGTGPGQK